MQSDVVARARDGDHDAFAELAAASIDRLYRVARLIVRDHGLAEDAVQDTLLQAWQGLPGLRDLDRFDAWLRRLLVRSCLRRASSSRQRQVTELRLLDFDRPTAQDAPRDLEIRDLLDRGFDGLPVGDRAVLVLHHYLELSVPEISVLLDVPGGTVKSRLHRATQRMRALLEADERRSALAMGGAK